MKPGKNKLQIIVTADLETGQIEVQGPLDMKPLVCKTLASAIGAVIDHAPPVIRPANGNGHGPLPRVNLGPLPNG